MVYSPFGKIAKHFLLYLLPLRVSVDSSLVLQAGGEDYISGGSRHYLVAGVIVTLFAGVVAGLSYGQSPDPVETALVKMQEVATNALPAEPARVREILPMLMGLSNQVAALHATMGESIRSCKQYADQMKGQVQAVTENDPALAEAYQKTYRELVIRVEQSVKTQKRLETIASQITARISSISE